MQSTFSELSTTFTAQPQVYEVLGQRVEMPCMVRDARAMHVIYPVRAAVAQSFVGPALEVVEFEPGTAQLVLGCVDYLDNDLGQYREVMMVFFVRPRLGAERRDGTFIYKLPVDGEFTCAAGRQIWGFPKTVETIEFEATGEQASCRLTMSGEEVLFLRLPLAGGIPGETPETEMVTYTYHPTLHAVPFSSAGRDVLFVADTSRVELSLGSHPLAEELRPLGLPTVPLMASFTQHFSGRFGPPVRLAE